MNNIQIIMCTTYDDMASSYDIENIVKDKTLNIFNKIYDNNNLVIKYYTIDLAEKTYKNQKEFDAFNQRLRRKYKIIPKKSEISCYYYNMIQNCEIQKNTSLEECLVTKKMRSLSGVIVISVIMPPDDFDCSYDCYYCPTYPDIAKSYIPEEPTVERGKQNNWDAYSQFMDRINTYIINGHPIDKIEIIILGGTFSCYQPKQSERFIRDLYYAANTLFDNEVRERMSIAGEIKINENAICKIIGMTIETRPDKISKHELVRFRKYGITRIQIGMQHTNNEILEKLNRESTIEDVITAIEIMKDSCFKVDIHIMPDLPYSSPEKDKEMFDLLLTDNRLQADQWKIYPTEVLDKTEIKKWYDQGTYKPYAEEDINLLINLCIYVKERMPRYIRINRLQRDFPGTYILGGNPHTNLRQIIHDKMKLDNKTCKCIRCNEVKDNIKSKFPRLTRLDYLSSNGNDIFLSYNTCNCYFCWKYVLYLIIYFIFKYLFNIIISWYGCGNEDTIYGFLRLRFSNNSGKYFPELTNMGLIRELHVYGQVITTYNTDSSDKSQHKGIGKRLLKEAERLSLHNKRDGMAVISGIGVRNYYRKQGFINSRTGKGEFLIKYF